MVVPSALTPKRFEDGYAHTGEEDTPQRDAANGDSVGSNNLPWVPPGGDLRWPIAYATIRYHEHTYNYSIPIGGVEVIASTGSGD